MIHQFDPYIEQTPPKVFVVERSRAPVRATLLPVQELPAS
jgi:hypothetical protein